MRTRLKQVEKGGTGSDAGVQSKVSIVGARHKGNEICRRIIAAISIHLLGIGILGQAKQGCGAIDKTSNEQGDALEQLWE